MIETQVPNQCHCWSRGPQANYHSALDLRLKPLLVTGPQAVPLLATQLVDKTPKGLTGLLTDHFTCKERKMGDRSHSVRDTAVHDDHNADAQTHGP